MKRRLRVGVVFGGRSGEHQVSLMSARSIIPALDPARYEVILLGITQEGQWLTSGNPMATLAAEVAPQEAVTGGQLAALGRASRRALLPVGRGRRLPPLDVVFPVLHGPFGEDGTLQGMLEMAGLPYVGCGVLASALAMDKITSKQIFAANGLPIVNYRGVMRKDWLAAPGDVLADLEVHLSYPVFVKPANLGSSVGISKARRRDELQAGLTEAARYDRKLLVEEAVPQAREIECAVLGNDDPIASVPGEIVPSNEFYDYSAKYIDGKSELLIPAPITAETTVQVRALALRAFRSLDCAGMARVDFLMNGATGALFVNEANSIPGFTQISMYPKLWEASGIPFGELVDRLIALALERHADKACSSTTYQGAAG